MMRPKFARGFILVELLLACLVNLARTIPINESASKQPSLTNGLSVALSPFEPVTTSKAPPGPPNNQILSEVERRQTTRAAGQESSQSYEQDFASSKSVDVLNESTKIETLAGQPTEQSESSDTSATTIEDDSVLTTTAIPQASMTTLAEKTSESSTDKKPEVETNSRPTQQLGQDESSSSKAGGNSLKVNEIDSQTGNQNEPASNDDLASSTSSTTQSPPTSTTTLMVTTNDDVPTTTEVESLPSSSPSSNQSESSTQLSNSTIKSLESESPTTQLPAISSTDNSKATITSVENNVTTAKPALETSTETEKRETLNNEKEVRKETCDHLPSYDPDEVQKVFREETTFRNGTIKGKFTYINFDQRYRLVHYTRLPYGPVKIDHVEELGRRDERGSHNQTGSFQSPPVNELPNSVLQLRNVLPNSLFGFPFLGSSSMLSPPLSERKDMLEHSPGSLILSNNYASKDRNFYSTDSISTPNLLSSSVPISLLPGQHRIASSAPSSPAADTLGQSYFENILAGSQQPRKVKADELGGESIKMANQASQSVQFQYAKPPQILDSPPSTGSGSSLFQTQAHGPQLISSPLAPPQLQYSYPPIPVYPMNHALSSTLHPIASGRQLQTFGQQLLITTPERSNKLSVKTELHPAQADVIPFSVSHRPHSHEHYVAPFMFIQPPSLIDEQPDNSRLKLRVKTSRGLNIGSNEQLGKSAQLRSSPAVSHQSIGVGLLQPANNPVQTHKQRQRAGKQHNHDGLRAHGVNSSPVVYHVLRSPVGRSFSLPRYDQAYAIAYDHDDNKE